MNQSKSFILSLALMSIASSCFAMPKADGEEEKVNTHSTASHSPTISDDLMIQLANFMQTTSSRLAKIEGYLANISTRVNQLEQKIQSNPIQSKA